KLANNGAWLMTVPSGTNHNFVLFHFNGLDEKFVWKEIKLSSSVSPEEIILSLDNSKLEASTGILSRMRYESVKNVTIAHYLLSDHRIDFDTSFRFNTLDNKTKDKNFYEEYFMTVPNKGFMLLKEYGKPRLSGRQAFSFNEPEETNPGRSEADSIIS